MGTLGNRKVYGTYEDVIIETLTDLSNEDDISFEWGRYLLKNTKEILGNGEDENHSLDPGPLYQY